jgi:riboflavin synthase
VDGIGEISSLAQQGDAWLVSFSMPKSLAKYLVNKGFITIDGMSITIIETWAKSFSVAFIPYTIQHSIVQFYRRGTKVNLEVDILAKYVEKFLETHR